MDNKTSESTVSTFIEKNLKVLVGILVVIILFVAVFVVSSSISSKATAKGIASVDEIDYAFRNDGSELSEADLSTRQEKALADIESLTSKGGIVGVRANMLKAEILFEKKDWNNSRDAWVKAADAKKAVYTAPICYYNAAVCSENLNDLEGAVNYYTKATKADDFLLIDHAYFNLGRVNETKGDVEAAVSAYDKVCELHPTSKFADLAKDRSIALKAAK